MNLKELRTSKNLSQKEFAERVGITTNSIRSYENGSKSPTIAHIRKIADFFNVEVSSLIKEELEGYGDVNQRVLERANSKCELCEDSVPEELKNTPYLTIYQLEPGDINFKNTAAVCPVCKFKLDTLKLDADKQKLLKKISKVPKNVVTLQSGLPTNPDLIQEVHVALIESKDFEEKLRATALQVVDSCTKANSEATIASRIENKISEILKYFGEDYAPIREESVVINDNTEEKSLRYRHKQNKRADSRFSNVITEYKQDILVDLEKNKNQLDEYLQNISRNEEVHIDKYFGVLTDGKNIVFLSYSSGKKIVSPLQNFNLKTLKELIKVYLSLGRKELSAKELVADFSLDSSNQVTINLAKTLYDKLITNQKEGETKYESEWEKIFKLGGHNDNNTKSIKDRKNVLANYFDVPVGKIDETKALFCLHTAYVVLIKLIAYNVTTEIFFKSSHFSLKFDELARLDSRGLRSGLSAIESGEIFKQVGILNLLEGDFFSWYLHEEVWDENIFSCLTKSIEILSEYDPSQRLFNRGNVHDFFKVLYQSIIPKEVRHSLGEYYTPDWLADHVVNRKLNEIRKLNPLWRGIDPCCGSGTFVMKMIEYVLREEADKDNSIILKNVLKRVYGYDINPLAVLTCRINYFIAIARFIDVEDGLQSIVFPVKYGDAALVPKVSNIMKTDFISYEINEDDLNSLNFRLPKMMLMHHEFISVTQSFEAEIFKSEEVNTSNLTKMLLDLCDYTNEEIQSSVEEFVESTVYLMQKGWSRAWIRTIFSVLSTMVDGKFNLIASNPPWIDWKALPDGYREILKRASLEQHVFSGDNFTGGINLNLCALIANVVADNWLESEGVMGFLMPKSIAFQQTYAGFRELVQVRSGNLNYDEFIDWSKSGDPFKPVTEKFMTYYFKKSDEPQEELIPVVMYEKRRGENIFEKKYKNFEAIADKFNPIDKIAYMASEHYNNFTFTDTRNVGDIPKMKLIAGQSEYKGRVGLGLYPKEAIILEVLDERARTTANKVWVSNYQNKKSERKVAVRQVLMDTKFLYPVIEGPNIVRFGLEKVKFVAPFPYKSTDLKRPIPREELELESKSLLNYYDSVRDDIGKTDYNQRVQGKKGEFYSITRVGPYTFAPVRVAFRNNTKWVSTVIKKGMTPWNEEKMYLLLDHACSISQDNEGNFITEDEAHYICAVMNSDIATNYIIDSSDSRSFKTDLPLRIEKYDKDNENHVALSHLSKIAHDSELSEEEVNRELSILITTYLNNLS
ncbi:helix-turn-helix domain-containing protein [Rossellomorea vietnamensis]|uniref:helix-turn-helix domain-containing protein n=1 Tax=Rossellomorea vietnamensis TaxID=218284 RepID=UPI0016537F5E|nr:helix-turn-helix domain-containing protein [Rossellomorea vietnamensis]